jgi:PAS domain S-box-containing protein
MTFLEPNTNQSGNQLTGQDKTAAPPSCIGSAGGGSFLLQPLTAALLECVTPAEVVQTIVERGIAALEAEAGLVVLIGGAQENGEEAYLQIVGACGYSEEVMSAWRRFPLSAPLPLSDAVRKQAPLFFTGRADLEAHYPEMFQKGPMHPVKASVSLPLVERGGRAIGGLHFSFPDEREAFSEADRAFLDELARQCSLALGRALLLEETEGTDRGTSILRLAVAAHVDPAEVEALQWLRRSSPIDMTQTGQPPVAAILSGETVFVPVITPAIVTAAARNEEQLSHIKRLDLRSLVSVPLRSLYGPTTVAITLAVTHASGRTFTSETVALAEELGRRAAVAVDNARLYEQAQHEIAERSRAEHQAAQVAADLRLITDAAPLLIAYIGADLRYRFVNKGYADWFGRSQNEIIGRAAQSVIGPTAFAKVRTRLLAALGGERLTFEEKLAYGEGHVRYVHADYVPDRGEDGAVHGVVAVVSDITARREAEQAREAALATAEAARHQTEVVLESIGEMFYALDSAFRLTYVNRRVEEAWGKKREELLNCVLWDVLPQVVGTFSYNAQQEAMRERRVIRFQTISPVLRRWIECSCYPSEDGGISVYFRDIQEQKEAEASLRESEARHRRLAREMLYSLTEGRMRLAEFQDDLPAPLSPISDAVALSERTLRVLRKQVEAVAEEFSIVKERRYDLLTAVGEASMNAVKHGRHGVSRIHADAERGVIQVWVVDQGPGIAADQIHRALERGWTTGGFGHGWWFILKAIDRVYLLTRPAGTTVVLEMDRDVSVPSLEMVGPL